MKNALKYLKIMADEARLKIIMMLSRQDMCVCDIMNSLGMSQPAVSHHLRILKKGGLIRDEKDGRWIFYSLNSDAFLKGAESINNELFSEILNNVRRRQPHRQYDTCLMIEKI